MWSYALEMHYKNDKLVAHWVCAYRLIKNTGCYGILRTARNKYQRGFHYALYWLYSNVQDKLGVGGSYANLWSWGFVFLSAFANGKGVALSKSFCLWLDQDVGQKKARGDWTQSRYVGFIPVNWLEQFTVKVCKLGFIPKL